ncbi:uncharacterized protein KZ484_002571 [Pholidichthys leucotaenia]
MMVGVCATTGLCVSLFILAGVSLVSSLTDKVQQKELEENVKKLQKEAARMKAENMLDSVYLPQILSDIEHIMDISTSILDGPMKTVLPPLLEFMEDLKGVIKKLKKFMHKEHEKKAAEIKDHEEKLRKLMERITVQHKDEL